MSRFGDTKRHVRGTVGCFSPFRRNQLSILSPCISHDAPYPQAMLISGSGGGVNDPHPALELAAPDQSVATLGYPVTPNLR
jgi:hypothetical protein